MLPNTTETTEYSEKILQWHNHGNDVQNPKYCQVINRTGTGYRELTKFTSLVQYSGFLEGYYFSCSNVEIHVVSCEPSCMESMSDYSGLKYVGELMAW